jgi:hypothetical protein
MIKIINNQDRNILSEGRSNNMGFAFCNNTNGDDYETIQPISPCKDYLNDVIYNERTGLSISAHGLHLKDKQGLFDNTKWAYLAIAICPYKYKHSYNEKGFIDEKENLSKYHKHLEYFINYFEELLNIDIKSNTIISEVEDNLYLVEVPLIWTESTYMISLYSLLLRAGQTYNDTSVDPFKFLEDNKCYQPDISLIRNSLPKLKDIIKYGPLPQDFSTLKGDTSTHNLGIVSYKLDYPSLKVEKAI